KKRRDQTQWRQGAQIMYSFRMPLLQFPQNSASRTNSKLLAEMVQPHTLLQTGIQISPILLYYTKTEQKMLQLLSPELDHYLNFFQGALKTLLLPDD
ncbi:hypothetical protein STEG23_017814, partial [Scotinomys teguina]